MNKYQNQSAEELQETIIRLEKENRSLRERLEKKSEKRGEAELDSHFDKNKYAIRILESLPDMLSVITPSGTLVEVVSSEETNHVGASNACLAGRDISTMLPEEAYRNVKENLDYVVAHQKGSTGHHSLCVDNETHFYENRIFPLDERYTLCMCRDVTEATIAKQNIELTNKKMEMAEKIASLSHWYFYGKTQEIEAPGILPQLLGVDDEHVRCSGTVYLKYVHPDDREKMKEQLLHPDTAADYTEHRIWIGGKLRYLHTRVIHTYEKDGEHIVEGYVQDMTYVVERVHELEKVKYAVNMALEEIYACRPDGMLVFANQKFISRYGLSEPISRYRIYDLLPFMESEERWHDKLNEIRRQGGNLQYIARDTKPDGSIATLDTACYIIREHDNEEVIWFFARDVSIRVQQENRIRELNYVMDAILNNIPVYLFVKDPDNEFRYLYWNKAFEEHSHIPASDVLGRTDFEVFPNAENAEKFRRDDLELLKNGERIEFLEDYTAANGDTRIVKTSKALIPTENKTPLIIGVSWDITDLKNTERELIAAKMKAEESDRLKSVFLANMSHEIRTPLNAIVGFSKLIATEESIEEKQQYSDIIDTNAEVLLQLINDILDISKIEAGTLEFIDRPMDLSELCRNMYETHKGRTKEGVRLVYDEIYPELNMTGDQNRIAQVITNLLTNAIKFTGQGEIRFGYDIRSGMIDFYVKDTGTGIPKEKLDSIFERFIKLNNFAQGTGLGLAISRMIVEKLHGRIWAESRLGKGSTFHFSIPYNPVGEPVVPVRRSEPFPVEKQPGSNRQKTILIAEDIESNYMLIKAFIGKKYRCIRAGDGAEAVKLFKEKSPDLILMDIKMPGMSGLDATRIIRKHSEKIPIVALTAFAFESDRLAAMKAGCNDFITKPLSLPDLGKVLDRYLGC